MQADMAAMVLFHVSWSHLVLQIVGTTAFSPVPGTLSSQSQLFICFAWEHPCVHPTSPASPTSFLLPTVLPTAPPPAITQSEVERHSQV